MRVPRSRPAGRSKYPGGRSAGFSSPTNGEDGAWNASANIASGTTDWDGRPSLRHSFCRNSTARSRATSPAMRRYLIGLAIATAFAAAALAQPSPIAQRSNVRAALDYVKRIEPQTLDEQARICEIPAPPFEERIRAEYFQKRFVELGLKDVRIDKEGNVLGMRPGKAATPLLVFSAHLDTVFPAGTNTKVTRTGTLLKGPGIADDCRGLAIVLAVARAMNEAKIVTQGTVVFVATVGEEGLGDLRGVRHLFDKELAGRITHFISLDGTGLGVATGAVGSYRYRAKIRAGGGQRYGGFGLVNPVHGLGPALEQIGGLGVPDSPRSTFNVGRIEGGTSVSSVAQSASFEIDMRSVSAQELDNLDGRFRVAVV